MLYLTVAGADGRHLWDIERQFPESQVRTVLTRLVQEGLVAAKADGVKRHGLLYVRSGKPLTPQQKLEVFVGVPA